MRVLAAALLVLVLAGCTPSASPSASVSVVPTASSTMAPTSAPTKAPTAAPEPTADLGDFICSYPYAVDGTSDRAQIDDVRVGSHKGYDRIVFQFQRSIPAMDVKVGKPPFSKDPSGLPLNVAGNDFLVFVLRGGTAVTPDGTLTYEGTTNFKPDYPLLVQFVQAGDFEAQSEWVAGLTGPACIRAFTLTGPDRLVIDLAAK